MPETLAQCCRSRPQRRIYLANELETIEDARVGSLCEALMDQPPLGFDAAVVKRGVTGVIVAETIKDISRQVFVPAFPIHTNSTTGTGDVFAVRLRGMLGIWGTNTCSGGMGLCRRRHISAVWSAPLD